MEGMDQGTSTRPKGSTTDANATDKERKSRTERPARPEVDL